MSAKLRFFMVCMSQAQIEWLDALNGDALDCICILPVSSHLIPHVEIMEFRFGEARAALRAENLLTYLLSWNCADLRSK